MGPFWAMVYLREMQRSNGLRNYQHDLKRVCPNRGSPRRNVGSDIYWRPNELRSHLASGNGRRFQWVAMCMGPSHVVRVLLVW